MVTCDDRLFCEVRCHIGERLQQHYDNLRLWENGYLAPTEPDEDERRTVVRELKAAIAELEPLARMCGMLPPEQSGKAGER